MMRKEMQYLIVAGVCAFAGAALWWWQQGYVVIYKPLVNLEHSSLFERYRVVKKKVLVSFWLRGAWHQEETEAIWPPEAAEALKQLVHAWLTILDEEEITSERITLQSVVMTASGNDAYISFDRSPFDKESSTHDKLMLTESLLKTLRDNGIQAQNIYLLVHHKPLYDYHLDFSHPWPLQGFVG